VTPDKVSAEKIVADGVVAAKGYPPKTLVKTATNARKRCEGTWKVYPWYRPACGSPKLCCGAARKKPTMKDGVVVHSTKNEMELCLLKTEKTYNHPIKDKDGKDSKIEYVFECIDDEADERKRLAIISAKY